MGDIEDHKNTIKDKLHTSRSEFDHKKTQNDQNSSTLLPTAREIKGTINDYKAEDRKDTINDDEVSEDHKPIALSHISEADEVICTVCQDEFIENELIIELDCGHNLQSHSKSDQNVNLQNHQKHIFHTHCIKEWLKVKFTCPICRTDLHRVYSHKVINQKRDDQIDPEMVKAMYAEDVVGKLITIFR